MLRPLNPALSRVYLHNRRPYLKFHFAPLFVHKHLFWAVAMSIMMPIRACCPLLHILVSFSALLPPQICHPSTLHCRPSLGGDFVAIKHPC